MKKQLKNTIFVLLKKELILYPTDTVWGIGCDATSYEAVKKIYALKNRIASKSLVVLVSSLEMLKDYVLQIPAEILGYLILEQNPVTVIYDTPKNLASNTFAKDNTIAIRIVSKGFSHQLIKKFGKPIVATSANVSGEPFPKKFSEISNTILKGVDYIVDLQHNEISNKASKIIKIDASGKTHVIRH